MTRCLPALVLACAVVPIARADDATDLRDKALKAYAKDAADVKKAKTFTIKASGVRKGGTDPIPAALDVQASWPGMFRGTWEFGVGMNKAAITLAGIDDRGWRRGTGTPAVDLGIEELNDFRADAYAYGLSMLAPLADADLKLGTAASSKVGSDTVLGLKVSRRPWPDVTLYFDEKTFLLRKMAYRGREGGVTLPKEMTYGGHKESHGLMLPTTQTTTVQGIELMTWNEMTYTFPAKLEAKDFEKPEK